jgi:trimeric autotransporter adhesin
MSKPTLWSIIFMLSTATAFAQVKVGDNPNTILPTSALEIESTNKGVLIPRMTKAQKNAIATPSTGLLVFQSAPDSVGFHYYNGGWLWLNPNNTGNDWKTTGNVGTDTAVNFIGTTDNEPLRFKQNNVWMGQWDVNKGNYLIGKVTGKSITNGTNNIGMGDSSLYANTTGSYNVAMGYRSLRKNITGSYNTALGYESLLSNTGGGNTAIGSWALSFNTTGGGNTAVGSVALERNTTGNSNTAVGEQALGINTTGTRNNAIGYGALSLNTTGSHNIAMGYNALENNSTGNRNIAIGGIAGVSNFTGNTNISIGYASLFSNSIGNNNVAIGDSAAFYSTVSDIVAIGSKALYKNTTGIDNFALGSNTLYSNTTGQGNFALGNSALYDNTTGNRNVALGINALTRNTTGIGNFGLGYDALSNNTIGGYNVAIGDLAMRVNNLGSSNIAIGTQALLNKTSGIRNVVIGASAGSENYNGDNNIFIGENSGFFNNGSSNVFIGSDAGRNAIGSNQLFIDNSSTLSPLIFGDFSTNLLRVNGTVNINNQYSLPTVDGATNQVLYTNGAGTVGWANAVGAANNGLNVLSSVVKLGGTLTDSTTITQGSRSMVFDLNGTGDFYIRKNTTDDAFMVKNNGFVGLNTNDPQYRLHIVNVSGGNGPFGRGLVIENSNTGSIGEASIAFKNNGPGSVPANRAWMSGLNNATNYVFAYGDSLKPSNVKMKLDTAGNVSIGINGVAAQSRFDVFGSIGNSIKLISANYTANDDDHTIIVSAGTGAITIVLPAASTCERREYIIVNRTNTDKTVSPAYNDFSGTSTAALANNSITLQSNGTNWFRIR